jgi:hypothetical protein
MARYLPIAEHGLIGDNEATFSLCSFSHLAPISATFNLDRELG